MQNNFSSRTNNSRVVNLREWSRPTSFQTPKNKKFNFFWLGLFIFALLLGAAILGFFLFFKSPTSPNSLAVSWRLPKSSSAGEQIELVVDYKNLDKVALQDLELLVAYPEGFYFSEASSQPFNQENTLWKLPNLAVGANSQLIIKGELYGQRDDSKEFALSLGYRPANFNARFTEKLSGQVKINQSYLDLAASWPTNLPEGQALTTNLLFSNPTENKLENLVVGFDSPATFSWASSTGQGQWNLPTLEAQTSAPEIKLEATLVNSPLASVPIIIKVWSKSSPEKIIFKQTITLPVVKPDLSWQWPTNLNLVKLGSTINPELVVKNIGTADLQIAGLTISSASKLIDWSAAKSDLPYDLSDNSLTFKPTDYLAKVFGKFIPNQEQKFVVSLPLIAAIDADKNNFQAATIELKTEATLIFFGQQKIVPGPTLTINLDRPTNFSAIARYWLDENKKVGQGPIPPVVGQATSYRVYWKVSSAKNDLKNVNIKATLPKDIEFMADKVNTNNLGALTYTDKTRQVLWKFDSLANGQEAVASFGLRFIPRPEQINQIVTLINQAVLSATDGNDKTLKISANQIATDLPGDPVVAGQGQVVSQ